MHLPHLLHFLYGRVIKSGFLYSPISRRGGLFVRVGFRDTVD